MAQGEDTCRYVRPNRKALLTQNNNNNVNKIRSTKNFAILDCIF